MMLSSQTAAARSFFGRVQSGVVRLHSSVHQQLSHQFDAVSLTAANALSGSSADQQPSNDVVVSHTGETIKSLFVVCTSASASSSSTSSSSSNPHCDDIATDAVTTSSANTTATSSDRSDLLLTALDGVSLTIASYFDAQSLHHVQLVNRAWRAFIVTNRNALYAALLPRMFETVVAAPTALASFMQSLRHELMLELLHAKAVEPTLTALEAYCSHTQLQDHGFVGMFCDVVEFTDQRVARFVSTRRHHALSVVLAATADDVNAFRKRSGFTRPIAFVPVRNPHWPSFELPPVDAPGFMGYAFDFVRMAPGYERLRDTVVKSILRDLMVFDTRANAAAYGAALGRPPFAAILDDTLLDPTLHMRFSTPLRRRLHAQQRQRPIAERIDVIEQRIQSIDAQRIAECA